MKYIAILLCITTFGCMTQPKIETTSPWEGHYFSFDELKHNIENQQLNNNQSMWLLSNTTLKRLLKSTGK